MPRKQKTISGDDPQKIASVPGQRYGEGIEQADMQRKMPAPQVEGPPPNGTQPQVAAPMKAGPTPEMLQEFLQANNPQLLSQSQMPDQPVTHGLSTGPGAGTEAMTLGATTTPIARTLRQISAATGNPKWARLAERANL